MDFKQLESFIAVVKYGSFTNAAQRLYTSQPTISAHIRMLEEELNTRLIIRTTKSVEVTEKGWELYDCAEEIFKCRDRLLNKWKEERGQILKIGASTIPSAYVLPEVLPEFGKRFPGAYFVLEQGDSGQVIQGVLHGAYDVGLVGSAAEEKSLKFVPFFRDKMVLITPVSEHYLKFGSDKMEWDQIFAEPMILREEGSGSRKAADTLMDRLKIDIQKLNVVARVNDQESIKNMVAGGLGVSIISHKAAENLERERRILVFDLPEQAAMRDLYLVYKKDYLQKEYLEQFISYVERYYSE